jgi:hypothetical protein
MPLDELLLTSDSDRTWSVDPECDLVEGAGIYAEVTRALLQLMADKPSVHSVTEDWDDDGVVRIRVRLASGQAVLEVPGTAEILHPAIVDEVNRALEASAPSWWKEWVGEGDQLRVRQD